MSLNLLYTFWISKNSVTIIGPSAGGASVTYLIASPLTNGTEKSIIKMLFKNAILFKPIPC